MTHSLFVVLVVVMVVVLLALPSCFVAVDVVTAVGGVKVLLLLVWLWGLL